MQLFKLAFDALMCNDVSEKISQTQKLKKHQIKSHDLKSKLSVKKISMPGRPLKPKLASFQTSPKRDRSDLGMIKISTQSAILNSMPLIWRLMLFIGFKICLFSITLIG